MKIIIPMAGAGKRMRPHTLTIPKPLIPVAGKPMVQRIVEEIMTYTDEPVEEIAYIVGRFGEEAEKRLIAVAESLGARGSIYYQDQPLGTAHAIYCAAPSLSGKVLVAFADTLFKARIVIDKKADGMIWVKELDDPRMFGVVVTNQDGVITQFIEHPKNNESNKAIIGIYYFADGKRLADSLKYLLDNNIVVKGEYQLTVALENLKRDGVKFVPASVDEWLDCGNKNATVYTNQRMLEHLQHTPEVLIHPSARIENSVVVKPCFVGENVVIRNSVVGAHVSVGKGTIIENSVINNSIIQENSKITNANITNSMVGCYAEVQGTANDLSVGDYNVIQI